MPRWLRMIRGMLGTGLTFSLGVGVLASVAGAAMWLLTGAAFTAQDWRELARLIVASAAWAFPIGVAFSGFLALTARGGSIHELSLPRVAILGAGGGLLLFGLLALNAWDAWSVRNAIGNATILVSLGTGSAVATIALARRASPALESGGAPPSLEAGGPRSGLEAGQVPEEPRSR